MRAVRASGRASGAVCSRPRFHDLRHTAASVLMAEGLNVLFVSRRLGHASSDTTLREYSHLFDQAEHAKPASEALEAQFGAVLR